MMADGLFSRFPWMPFWHAQLARHGGRSVHQARPLLCLQQRVSDHDSRQGDAYAAMPRLGVDPVPVACQMVQAFQTIVSRNAPHRRR